MPLDQNMTQEHPDIRVVIASHAEHGEKICNVLIDEVNKLGLERDITEGIRFEQLSFTLNRDPYSQLHSLEGSWSNEQGLKVGSILFHGDGSFFSEYDVVQQHPTKKKWFVEAVSAWGKFENASDSIKSEARLIPMP